ncbi:MULTISPECIES: DUF6230 family protein [unclassified Streptomyces]|uniref:DUF6230 family protein n=1 Tax=unclassified Streptomyces TaxID=2593676 RepID=UPI00201EA252|nr:DUF6230 family protein [Streptomyces sp. 35G-GA-8]MCL7381546.1 DUF6230 family protein [Streptomyces sp. 35G-GA-8]
MESQVRGGTRWRRFAVVMVPSVAATAAIGVALAQGALAASFSVSGQSFKVTADKLVGQNFVQYGGVAEGVDSKGNKVSHPVAVSGFKTAQITNMCQSVVTPLFGTSVTLVLKAGDKGTKIRAENLYLDVESLDADAEFKNIDIGVAAGSTKTPGIQPGTKADPNGFAQQADEAILRDVEQTAWATTAGTFKLPDLNLRLNVGDPKKYECY